MQYITHLVMYPRSGDQPFPLSHLRAISVAKLMDHIARFYQPSLGRFTQPDTIVPNPNNPQSLNRYAYVTNNPARYIDPSGHKGCKDMDDPDCEQELGLKKQLMQDILDMFGVTLTGDWSLSQMTTIFNALKDIGRKFADVFKMGKGSWGEAFRKVFGPMTFELSASGCPNTKDKEGNVVDEKCLAKTVYGYQNITFYGGEPGFAESFSKKLIAHELGHYFDNIISNRGEAAYRDWKPYDKDKNSTGKPPGYACFKKGFRKNYFGWYDDNNEYWADMFQAWVYPDSFSARWETNCSTWMDTQMATFHSDGYY